jgi:antitoxin VapB
MRTPDPTDPTSRTRRAKLFWNGRSQAVRLPKEFRFEGEEVEIRREGGKVILEEVRRVRRWPRGYWERLGELARGVDFPDVPPLPSGPDRPGLGEP